MKKGVKGFFRQPKVRYGSISVLLLSLFLCLLLIVNIAAGMIEKKYALRVDYSFNAATTTGEKTVEILKTLDKNVIIYALFEKGNEDQPLLELLDRYAAASERVTWKQIVPSLNPGLISRFSGTDTTVQDSSVVVYCEDTDRWRILDYSDFITLSLNYNEGIYEVGGLTYESSITGAIVYVTREKIPRAVFLQGHGEMDAEAADGMRELLENNQYDVVFSAVSDDGFELDPERDVLVILSPLKDMLDSEMQVINEFVSHGGSLLLSCDYSDPIDSMPNYRALLRSYGFNPLKGIVVADKDEKNTYYNQNRIQILPEMCSTDITLDLLSAGMDTMLMAGTGAFETPTDSDRNLIVSEVLKSSENAYLKALDSTVTSMDRTDEDVGGPFSLALQARKITADGYVSKAFITGCSNMLTDTTVQSMTSSQELTIRIMEFLLNQSAVDLGIMAKTAVRPQLSAKGTMAGSLVLVALPVSIAVLAAIILVPRKRRS